MYSPAAQDPDVNWTEIRMTTHDFNLLSGFIGKEVGIQLPPAKRVMLESRLRKRLRALGLRTFRDYTAHVFGGNGAETEIVHLIDAVTTNKTDFFREPHHFEFLIRSAVPALVEEAGVGSARPLQVWSAASSTGEEPFTLAMVLNEYAESQPLLWQVVATDISTVALDCARRAIYGQASATPIPPALKQKYLLRSRDREKALVRVVPYLRQKVTFQRLNLLSRQYDIPRPIDIVFCRNVFIYFNRRTQQEILFRFVEVLRPGGYVFLGHSETTNGLSVPLVQVAPTVYRKGG
jgi:chemotaxis protein methyltransferase CheR